NPGSLLISILLMIGVAFVIFIIMRAVLNRVGPNSGGNSTEMKKYRKAVKQSKQKYNTQPKKVNKHSQKIKRTYKRKRKNVPYLKVIDGKKTSNKENDQANYLDHFYLGHAFKKFSVAIFPKSINSSFSVSERENSNVFTSLTGMKTI